MYKVFFKERTVFLRDDFNDALQNDFGLFYKYENKEELIELVEAYILFNNITALHIFHRNLEFLRKEFTSCFKFVRAAGGLVYNAKGEFLVIKRNEIWDLPKGKAEKLEKNHDTAIREVSEECGLNSLIVKKSIIKTYHSYQLNKTPVLKETEWFEMYSAKSKGAIPQLKEGITETRWLKKSEATIIISNTYPSIIDVLKEAGILD